MIKTPADVSERRQAQDRDTHPTAGNRQTDGNEALNEDLYDNPNARYLKISVTLIHNSASEHANKHIL